MATIDIGSITFEANTATVTFSGLGFVYKNSLLVVSNAEDTATFPCKAGEAFTLEIHDGEWGAYEVAETLRPEIVWTDSSDADYYKIYLSTDNETYNHIYTQTKIGGTEIYRATCPVDLQGGWNFFKVTAVKNKVESEVDGWPHYIFEKPAPPEDLELSGGEGIFDLTVN